MLNAEPMDRRLASLAAFLLLPCSVALAEPPPKDSTPPIVTPPVRIRGARAAADMAAPSTVIGRREIEESTADLPKILDEQPGLRTSRIGGLGSFSALSIRGSTAEQVLVFVDGIPLNSAEGGPVDLAGIPLGPVDSVAVYRGVSPVIFGGSAIGGVVDVRTRRLERYRLEIEAGGGSFGTRKARSFFGLGDERWGLGLSVDYLGSAGDFSFTNDRGTAFDTSDDVTTERRNNHFDQVSAMAKGRLRVAPHVDLTLLDLFTWRHGGVPGLALYETLETGITSMRNLLGLRLKATRVGAVDLELSVTPYLSWSSTRFTDPSGEVGLGARNTDDLSLVPGLQVVARVPIGFGEDESVVLTPTASLEYRYEVFEPGGGDSTSVPLSERHFGTAAAEVALDIEPAALELIASARVEVLHSQLTGDVRFGLDPDSVSSPTTTAVTWRAAIVQSPSPDTTLKLNISRGIRFPSLFELFGDTGAVLGNPTLLPETGLTLDLGILHTGGWLPKGNVWTIEVYGFVTWSDDLIQLVQNAQNVSVAENVESARVAGVELGTWLDVLGHLRLRGSLTWMHTENTSDIAARQGKRLPFRPEWKGYAKLTGYHRFGRRVGELGLAFELEAIGGNVLDFANLVNVSSRLLLGVSAYLTALDERLRLDISANNLLSNQIQDFAGYPLPGLTVMAGLRWTPSAQPSGGKASKP